MADEPGTGAENEVALRQLKPFFIKLLTASMVDGEEVEKMVSNNLPKVEAKFRAKGGDAAIELARTEAFSKIAENVKGRMGGRAHIDLSKLHERLQNPDERPYVMEVYNALVQLSSEKNDAGKNSRSLMDKPEWQSIAALVKSEAPDVPVTPQPTEPSISAPAVPDQPAGVSQPLSSAETDYILTLMKSEPPVSQALDKIKAAAKRGKNVRPLLKAMQGVVEREKGRLEKIEAEMHEMLGTEKTFAASGPMPLRPQRRSGSHAEGVLSRYGIPGDLTV